MRSHTLERDPGDQQKMNQNDRKTLAVLSGLVLACAALLAIPQRAGAQDNSGTPPPAQIGDQPGDAPINQPQPQGQAVPQGQAQAPQPGEVGPETYSKDETLAAAEKFFGGTTEGLAKAIEKAFSDNGRPNAYIVGSEGAGPTCFEFVKMCFDCMKTLQARSCSRAEPHCGADRRRPCPN